MTEKLWGSRFGKKTDNLVDKFTSSISFDQRLAKYDILGSIAHAKMLGKSKIIPPTDAALIIKGLKRILKKVEKGNFKFDPKAEDVHSSIQDALFKGIGKPAHKLHTARSRNDQIVLDVRMYLKDELKVLTGLITGFQKAILSFAGKNKQIIIPSYTHLQIAQSVLLAHHLLA